LAFHESAYKGGDYLYREEVFAWDWGRTLLTELRHHDMPYFETVWAKMLKTYEAMWPNGMPPR
jgi:hypothetical protein